MANFAPARAACATGFAYAERREIVVEQEGLRSLAAAISVDVLRFFDRRKRDKRERLGFAALEDRRAMRTRQDPDFACDLAQILVAAAIHALLFVEHTDAERFL